MAEKRVFRADGLTVLSYGVLVISYVLFFGALILKAGRFSPGLMVFALLVLPVVAYFVFLLKKRVVITDEGIEVFGLTGRKFIKWNEIEEVSLTPGRKYFLFIADKEGKLAVIDDSFSNFEEILKEVKRRAPSKLPENYDRLVSSYRRSYTSNVVLIVAAAILLFILFNSILGGSLLR